MARPLKSEEQKVSGWNLWKRRNGPTAIHRELELQFVRQAVSLRTIKGWIAEWKSSPDDIDKEID